MQDARRYPATIDLMGIGVHRVGSEEILAYVGNTIRAGERAVIANVNVNCANLAEKNPWLKAFLNAAQIVFCDSDGIRWGLRILGRDLPPKVTYNVWLWELARWCAAEGFSMYLLGGRPGIAEKAAARLEHAAPGLRIAGYHHGYFDRSGPANDECIAKINAARADILLVCFGMPLQEQWIAQNLSSLQVHAIFPAGAALDYAAGLAKMTPPWIARLQMEWLYRLVHEPRRLFVRYVVGNPAFIARAIAGRLRKSRSAAADLEGVTRAR